MWVQVAGATLAVVSAAGEVTPLRTSYYTFGNISAREVQALAHFHSNTSVCL